jgi:hypothetical protein
MQPWRRLVLLGAGSRRHLALGLVVSIYPLWPLGRPEGLGCLPPPLPTRGAGRSAKPHDYAQFRRGLVRPRPVLWPRSSQWRHRHSCPRDTYIAGFSAAPIRTALSRPGPGPSRGLSRAPTMGHQRPPNKRIAAEQETIYETEGHRFESCRARSTFASQTAWNGGSGRIRQPRLNRGQRADVEPYA